MCEIEKLKLREEMLWINKNLENITPQDKINGYGFVHMKAAQNRFMRFLAYFKSAWPETAPKAGVIESPFVEIEQMKEYLNAQGADIRGKLFLKDDAHLPIAGSVKARGGIHEVIKIAEELLRDAGMLSPTDDYSKIDTEEYRRFLSNYSIQVGSTGNLGISIGRTAARLGFKVIVHMSRDAKEWKKSLLRSEGVIVREYDGDYSEAVRMGREDSEKDKNSFFIDDENSRDLFFGYATAAFRLKVQLYKAKVTVDDEHPLFVYLPCGVGGAPGGITFGLKLLFGKNVHCFFAEPVEAPCFLLGMASGKHSDINIYDIGLSGRTAADGLAVPRASGFVCSMMENLVSGGFTVKDDKLEGYKNALMTSQHIFAEPSACIGFDGVCKNGGDPQWRKYLEANNLVNCMDNATHIVWSTGGGLMEKLNK